MKKNGIILTLVLVLLLCNSISGLSQTNGLVNQSMYYLQENNPAYSGSWDMLGITASGKKLWYGGLVAPSSVSVAVHTPIASSNSGTGLFFEHRDYGISNAVKASADYNYKFRISGPVFLRLGIRGCLDMYNINSNGITNFENEEPYVGPINNPSFLSLGAGAYLSADKYYASISIPTLAKKQISGSDVDYLSQTLYCSGGYIFELNEIVKFFPVIDFSYTTSGFTQTRLNANAVLYNKLLVGFNYEFSSLDVFGLKANYMLSKHWMVGYAYDHIFKDSDYGFDINSHRLLVSYAIKLDKKRIYSPRYF